MTTDNKTLAVDVLATIRQMHVNSSHFRNGLPVLADHHHGEREREVSAIAAVEESHRANQMFVQAINEMQGITAEQSDERIYDEMPSSQLANAYFVARDAIATIRGEVP